MSQSLWQNGIKAAFPEAVQDIKIMHGMSALKTRVKLEMRNPMMYPEIQKVATVRRGLDLCPDELAFVRKRKELVRLAFANYLGLLLDEVHPDDVPIVAFGGSGGGFRAMIGCLGYCAEMKKSGLWDCISYVAGVSGACWAIAAYYKLGQCDMQTVIDHCKKRLSPYHPLSGEAVRAMLSAPGGAKVTLGPLIQKHKTGLDIVAMDYYSVFTTGWIFFQGDLAEHPMQNPQRNVHGLTHHTWHRLSGLREYLDEGKEPMPILTAIRHERPGEEWAHKDRPFQDDQHAAGGTSDPPDAWYQWFEMTPYEVGCDEIEAWVPTWGFGRPFSQGRSTMQVPEQSMALLLGLATSAPAAPLTSYLATIDRNLSGFFGTSIRKIAHGVSKMWGKEGTEEFENHHPLHACEEHNFMYEFTPLAEGEARKPGLENSKAIQLIDSGMDNNCPTYVLLHPRRETDIIINMDASSDVQKDAFQERVDQIGSRRGLKFTKRNTTEGKEVPTDPDGYGDLYAQIYDGVPCDRPAVVVDSYGRTVTNPPAPAFPKECTMVYMPLLPNEKVAPGFDPSTTKFSGSYNLVWEPGQVDTLVRVCEANLRTAEATIKTAMREVWQTKRQKRLASEHVRA
ncbi:putative cytosolic phospholipase A2 [Dactylonectria macrodidyma]|uniref:Lysophospholipase n=1 Tax=Dactylonectria macrodidyma TaxID=307937 RepID=A0A9P9J7D8_9HYPO|nr:putative cytosolic phospholipase A2 [Dactylonectria macrodidyma]